MGHGIDPLEYDKSFRDVEFYKQEYHTALPHLQLLSSGVPYGQVEKNEVEKLRKQLEEAKQGQQDDVENLRVQVKQLSVALTKVMVKLEDEN